MYYIRKYSGSWAVHNNFTGKKKLLNENEVHSLLAEFPNLRNALQNSRTVTFFRNKITSISDLP